MAIRRKRRLEVRSDLAELTPLYLTLWGKDSLMVKMRRKRKPATTEEQEKTFAKWLHNLHEIHRLAHERGIDMDELHAAHGNHELIDQREWVN